MTTSLSRVEAIARREADATGRPHVVLNLNRAGAPLYVCRELRDGIEADRIVSRFDPAPSAPAVEPVASVVGEAPARARYAPVYNPAGTGGYDIVDRDTGSADINGARHWFGDFHFAQKACDALNAGRPCPTMAEMCEAAPAGPVYHPLTVRALRIYQDAAKARFTRIPDADADEDYTSGAEWAASEGLRDPVDRLRAYTRERCGELLAKARAIRAKMRCGNWQGDNNPLDLAAVQEALLQRREDRRALVAAKSRAIAPAPAMVPQPVQQQQAKGSNPRGTVPVSNAAYRAMIAARDSGLVSFPEGVLERAFCHSHLTRAQWQDVCRRMRADAHAAAMVAQPSQQQQACAVRFNVRNDNPATIWNRLAARLGREPTTAEAKAAVLRILRGEAL